MTTTNQASTAVKRDEAASGIEWGIISGENTELTAQYPRMQFVHGEAKASGFMKTGGLFIGQVQYPNFTAEGFEPATLITDEGTEIEGYAASSTKLAIIRVKHQWIEDKKYHRNVPLCQALVAVKGCDDLINLSLRGATKSLEFQHVVNQHIGQNVSVANRTKPQDAKPIEPFALWLPIRAGAPRKVSGKDSDKSSTVTPPELIVPEKVDREYVSSLWVGGDNYRLFTGFFKETAVWQTKDIWEQREAVDQTPEFSGGEGFVAAGTELVASIRQLAQMKGIDEREMCLEITNGGTANFNQLHESDAQLIFKNLQAI